jgi:hypothetical protein
MSHRPLIALFLMINIMALAEERTLTEFKQLFTGIPRETMQDLRPGSRKMAEAAAAANAAVRQAWDKRTATLRMTVEYVEPFQFKAEPNVTRVRLRCDGDTVREDGVNLKLFLVAVPALSENAKLAKIKKGSKITFTGKITNVEIAARKVPELHMDVSNVLLN